MQGYDLVTVFCFSRKTYGVLLVFLHIPSDLLLTLFISLFHVSRAPNTQHKRVLAETNQIVIWCCVTSISGQVMHFAAKPISQQKQQHYHAQSRPMDLKWIQ